MATFQFTALDASGREKRGTIEAGTQQEAITAIQHHGLNPTNIYPLDQGVPSVRSGPQHIPGASSSAGTVIAILLACLALVVGGVALGWQMLRKEPPDPLGKGLRAYDFTTPKEALLSKLKIGVNKDIRAQIELEDVRLGPELQEQLKTLQVKQDKEWKGTTLLFYSYEAKGVRKYRVQGFEKDAKSGLYLPKYVSSYEVQKDNPTLAKQMQTWEKDGKFE